MLSMLISCLPRAMGREVVELIRHPLYLGRRSVTPAELEGFFRQGPGGPAPASGSGPYARLLAAQLWESEAA
ncbi:hypothetical protein GCM10011574_08130 [Microbispora bryophytorum]|uniref:Uncharacterized protein n=1 Tax=Microbispora bryophytorum TaxID=1460882 RepID=A0A8H9GUB4_9ACTN|nr:hypothetical protein GCM10011574_08130 [Microbispora bryophytorum]